jgi:hypothetical protein
MKRKYTWDKGLEVTTFNFPNNEFVRSKSIHHPTDICDILELADKLSLYEIGFLRRLLEVIEASKR